MPSSASGHSNTQLIPAPHTTTHWSIYLSRITTTLGGMGTLFSLAVLLSIIDHYSKSIAFNGKTVDCLSDKNTFNASGMHNQTDWKSACTQNPCTSAGSFFGNISFDNMNVTAQINCDKQSSFAAFVALIASGSILVISVVAMYCLNKMHAKESQPAPGEPTPTGILIEGVEDAFARNEDELLKEQQLVNSERICAWMDDTAKKSAGTKPSNPIPPGFALPMPT